MPDVHFADLVEIYRNTRFDVDGEGLLTVPSDRAAEILAAADADQALYDRIQVATMDGAVPAAGGTVRIAIGAPSPSLGLLVRDFDALFRAPGAAFQEPGRYYVVDAAYASGDEPAPDPLVRYRALLSVISIVRDAAAYADEGRRELVFIGNEKTIVPIRFDAKDLPGDLPAQSDRLKRLFDDPLHREEKAALLATAVVELVGSQRPTAASRT